MNAEIRENVNPVENPNLSGETLKNLEWKFKSNQFNLEDFKALDSFISKVGFDKNFLLELFRNEGIEGYQDFVRESKMPIEKRNQAVDGILLGYILGTIDILKKYSDLNNQG